MAVLFRFLLGCGADYSLQDENKETVVHKLAREGRTSWLYKIRAANSFERDRGGILCRLANMANAQGKTPLMLACYKANPSTVEELLSWGGDVSYTLPKKKWNVRMGPFARIGYFSREESRCSKFAVFRRIKSWRKGN